jgi:hypothetical protein
LNLQVQTLGGLPSDNPDVPAASISLFLFLLGAIAHIGTFAYDKRRGIFFPISIFLTSTSSLPPVFNIVGEIYIIILSEPIVN